MKDGGGVLPAACTQSIVGEEVYDVVTIEFSDTFDESYLVLSQRLRQRFPEASIVFVQLWNPSQLAFTYSSGAEKVNQTSIDLLTWKRDDVPLHSSELTMSVLESGPENWAFVQHDESEARLGEAMEQVGAGLVALPTPTSTDFSFPQNLHSFLTFFNEDDPGTLSAEGHLVIAKGLQRIIDASAILSKDREVRDRTGSWGSGDVCNLWYFNGQYEELKSTGRRLGFSHSSTNPGEHKHALEFRRHDTDGHVIVSNPFPEHRLLHLTYMTASDEEDKKVYPRTRIRLNGRPSVVVDPYHVDEDQESVDRSDAEDNVTSFDYHHLTRTSVVGMIPPGETTVNLDPLEKSQLHFRLVGASILSREASGVLPIDFTLEPEPAREQPSVLVQIFNRF